MIVVINHSNTLALFIGGAVIRVKQHSDKNKINKKSVIIRVYNTVIMYVGNIYVIMRGTLPHIHITQKEYFFKIFK